MTNTNGIIVAYACGERFIHPKTLPQAICNLAYVMDPNPDMTALKSLGPSYAIDRNANIELLTLWGPDKPYSNKNQTTVPMLTKQLRRLMKLAAKHGIAEIYVYADPSALPHDIKAHELHLDLTYNHIRIALRLDETCGVQVLRLKHAAANSVEKSKQDAMLYYDALP